MHKSKDLKSCQLAAHMATTVGIVITGTDSIADNCHQILAKSRTDTQLQP